MIDRVNVNRVTSEGTDTSKSGSDPTGIWAAAEDDHNPSKSLIDQGVWAMAVEADLPSGGDITCDPRTFMPLDQRVETSIGVLGSDPDLVEQALNNAMPRMMMMVTTRGRELSDEEFDDFYTRGVDPPYTPNYISDPERLDGVVGMHDIDTMGERYTWMFRTMLRIVAEELRAAGAIPAKIVPFPSTPVSYPSDAQLA